MHLDKMPLEEEVPLEEVSLMDEVPLEEVHLDKVHPYKKVPLGEVVPLEEQHKRELHQMEADSPAAIVIVYMCIIAKPRNGKGLWIGMDPLRGVFGTLEGLV